MKSGGREVHAEERLKGVIEVSPCQVTKENDSLSFNS